MSASSKPKRRTKRGMTTASMSERQHAAYRELLKRTGLHQSVFMDRLLQLGERQVFQLLVPDGKVPDAVPA